MAATFDQLITISKDAGFQGRVQYAMSVAAVNVSSEDPATQGHSLRKNLSIRVLGGNFNFNGAVLAVLQNLAIVAEANPAAPPDFAIPDGDIQFQVNSIWNALAGA